jgi:hypothetical protein
MPPSQHREHEQGGAGHVGTRENTRTDRGRRTGFIVELPALGARGITASSSLSRSKGLRRSGDLRDKAGPVSPLR